MCISCLNLYDFIDFGYTLKYFWKFRRTQRVRPSLAQISTKSASYLLPLFCLMTMHNMCNVMWFEECSAIYISRVVTFLHVTVCSNSFQSLRCTVYNRDISRKIQKKNWKKKWFLFLTEVSRCIHIIHRKERRYRAATINYARQNTRIITSAQHRNST